MASGRGLSSLCLWRNRFVVLPARRLVSVLLWFWCFLEVFGWAALVRLCAYGVGLSLN
jgi:hypothetical protein